MVGTLLAHVGTKCSSQEKFEIYLQQILRGRYGKNLGKRHGNAWQHLTNSIRSNQIGTKRLRSARCLCFIRSDLSNSSLATDLRWKSEHVLTGHDQTIPDPFWISCLCFWCNLLFFGRVMPGVFNCLWSNVGDWQLLLVCLTHFN